MDPMTGILCAAIAALWGYVHLSGKRCEKRNDDLSAEIKATKDGVIQDMRSREAEARSQAVTVAKALERSNELASDTVEVMRDIKELTFRTVRALRRYASGEIQPPKPGEDESDTSKFFQDGVDPLEPKQK